MKKVNKSKTFFSIPEAAQILGVSRVAVLKKVQKGQIVAEKVGRNYIISAESLQNAVGEILSPHQREEIQKAVKKAVGEFEETFRKLGKE